MIYESGKVKHLINYCVDMRDLLAFTLFLVELKTPSEGTLVAGIHTHIYFCCWKRYIHNMLMTMHPSVWFVFLCCYKHMSAPIADV